MINQELVKKMFSLSQENHPEKLWVISQILEASNNGNVVDIVYDMGCGLNKTTGNAIGVDQQHVTNLAAELDYLPSVATNSVDVIISRHSLEHMLDPVKTLMEWRRIMKDDGKMIIVLPDHKVIDTFDMFISGGKHLHAYTKESFKNLVSFLPRMKVDKIETVVEGWSFGAVLSLEKREDFILDADKTSISSEDFEEAGMVCSDVYNVAMNQINGMMSDEELLWLFETAKKMDSVVEIGSWMGRSSHALLSGCKGPVTCIDTFAGSADPIETGHRDVYQYFMQNVGHFENLEVIKKASLEAVDNFWENAYDLIFIDGGHQYHEVVADIKAWLPKAKKMIAVHDYHDVWVKKAVDELLGEGKVCGTIFYLELN